MWANRQHLQDQLNQCTARLLEACGNGAGAPGSSTAEWQKEQMKNLHVVMDMLRTDIKNIDDKIDKINFHPQGHGTSPPERGDVVNTQQGHRAWPHPDVRNTLAI